MPSLHDQFKGFTLIEVMIAMVILAVGILGLTTMQIVAVKGNAFSSEMSYATMLAQSRIEQLKNIEYANIATIADEIISADVKTKGIEYTVKRTVIDNNPAPNMKMITIQVEWDSLRQGKTSETVQTSFQTIIAR